MVASANYDAPIHALTLSASVDSWLMRLSCGVRGSLTGYDCARGACTLHFLELQEAVVRLVLVHSQVKLALPEAHA